MTNLIKLFFSAFTHVLLISFNTYLIVKEYYIGVFVLGACVSLVWTFNIKKMSIGTLKERIVYSLGAGTGAVTGLYLSVTFFKYLLR